MPELYIGLISGTSMDGIDAVLASFDDGELTLRGSLAYPYPAELRARLKSAVRLPDACNLDSLGTLDRWVGECFRDAALKLMNDAGADAAAVTAIGSHGQTLRHRPGGERPYSLQIGDAATIAEGTGITTVSDFRRADIAAGGQGAPLVPPFHEWLFAADDVSRIVLNIGGIANITVLPADGAPVTGFDTGPGNTLLDAWISEQRSKPYDTGGRWAADGEVIPQLLNALLDDAYFALPPPKSTGLEAFNLDWLRRFDLGNNAPRDIQATLSELTAASIAGAISAHAPLTGEAYVCGGGAHNADLLSRLRRYLPEVRIRSTSAAGLDPDWVEAVAFAWLAMRTINKQSGNLPGVTGARHKTVLGAIHYG